jgi:hypothetical protein
MFRNAQDVLKSAIPTSISDVVNLDFAADTTVYSTVNYIGDPVNEYLLSHQYDPYLNFSFYDQYRNIHYSGTTYGELAAAVAQIEMEDSPGHYFRVSAGDTGEAYMTASQLVQGLPRFMEYIQGILGNAAGNIYFKQLKPAGGQFVDTIYYPPVVIYFYHYDKPSLIQIYQNNNLIIDSSAAQVLTTEDKNLLVGAGGKQWFDDETQYFLKDFQQQGGGYVTYAGKLTFNYNPAAGRHITIKATSPHSIRWRYVIAYPIDGRSVGCVPPNPVYNIPPTFTAEYQNIAMVAWCGNSCIIGFGNVQMLAGYTETWTPFVPPAAKTSVIPFDISANWYHGGQG